jgi:hypothetical protein
LTKSHHDAGVLHEFSVISTSSDEESCWLDQETEYQMSLDEHLNLGAGPDGIIGRRISLFEQGRTENQFAEGIIGWN